MMQLFKRLCISMLLPVLLAPATCGGADDSPAEAFVKWAASNAVPLKTVDPGASLEDLRPLRKLINDARLVCLGESRHDAREHFLFKHRMIRFLVEEMGFTLFAMEESLPCARRIDAYILGGEGDPEAILNRMGGWYIWDTEEVLALVRWMRAYNDDPAHERKVRFFGIDITEPLTGVQDVLEYLDRVDPEFAASLRKKPVGLDVFSPDFWSKTMESYGRLSPEELAVLKENIGAMYSRFERRSSDYIARSSEAEYEWVFREALVVKQANDLFTTFVQSTFQEAGDVRERAMAGHIRWILNRQGKGERLIVWAHNFHVTRNPIDLDIPGRPPTKGMVSMTQHLDEEMGEGMVAVGCSFNQGADPKAPLAEAGEATVDGLLARAGHAMFLVDLRTAPEEGAVFEWLDKKQKMRGEGGFAELVPRRTYDALFFIDKIARTRPNPLTLKRFGKR